MPTLFILIPLIGIVILNLFYSDKFKPYSFWISTLVTIIQIFLSLAIIFRFMTGVLEHIEITYFVSFSLDFFSSLVLFTIGLINFIALLVRKYSMKDGMFNFSNLILLIMIGMNGTVMVTDIFSLYVFLEITALTSFLLIAQQKELSAMDSAFKYFIMTVIAAVLMLTGIGILFMTYGTLDYASLSSSLSGITAIPLQLLIAFVFLITGLSIKAGLIPFHMWVPETYTFASPAVSVILAGIVTKAGGIYAILRLIMNVFNTIAVLQDVFAFLAIISIVIGAILAMGQRDFKRMLAFSSISQVGYIIIGAACATPLGLIGALLHFFNHATFKSLLFVNSAAVEMQTGTRNLDKLQGLAARMKITGGTSVVGFLSTAGIPPLSGFWSKLLIIIALWQTGWYAYAVIALLASILTLAYFLILQRRVFFGKLGDEFENIKEANAGLTSSAIILSVITVAVGIGFPFILNFLKLKGLL